MNILALTQILHLPSYIKHSLNQAVPIKSLMLGGGAIGQW